MRWWGQRILLASLAASTGCATRSPRPPPPSIQAAHASRDACPSSLRALAPPHAQRWLWLRPRALFDHPQLGPLLSELTRDAGERALVAEAERGGVEVRTIDRVLLVERAGGAVALAGGSFDARRIIDLHWDRMLPPQQRREGAAGVARIEGTLGGRVVALATDAACGLVARAERDPRLVDRLLDDRRTRSTEVDPPELLRWHLEGAPAGVDGPDSAALTATLWWTELRADAVTEGLRVTIVLAGPLPGDTPDRVSRVLTALSASALGTAVGADDWLHPASVAWVDAGDEWRGDLVVPWRGLRAIVALARGTVESPHRPEL